MVRLIKLQIFKLRIILNLNGELNQVVVKTTWRGKTTKPTIESGDWLKLTREGKSTFHPITL